MAEEKERLNIRLHVYDTDIPVKVDREDEYFYREAAKLIRDIQGRGKFPILCGGTGFYIRALLYGIDFAEGETDPYVRERL